MEATAAQVIRHLGRGVRGAEAVAYEGTEAPVVEAGDGMHTVRQGAGQSHDA